MIAAEMEQGGTAITAADCLGCGACCDYSSEWPRFTLEDDRTIELIPEGLVARGGSGMSCHENRCSALSGEVGKAASCSIYALRPIVCRDCEPGDAACLMARRKHGL